MRRALYACATVALLCGCAALLEPLPADPATGQPPQVDTPGLSHDQPVDVDGDGTPDGTVSIDVPSPGPRDATVGDALIDSVTGIGGAVSGNPLLWGVFGQLARLGLGLFQRRRQGVPA